MASSTLRRVGAGALLAGVVAALTPTMPAQAAAPTCTPPAPVVVGSRRGLTVDVRPCADPTGVTGYRLTAYVTGHDLIDPYDQSTPPVVIDVAPGSHLVRIRRERDDLPLMPSYRFRARAIGTGGDPGPLGPSSAGAPHPYTTSSSAANRTWTELFGQNPTASDRAFAVRKIEDESLFHYLIYLFDDAFFDAQHDVTKLYLVALGRFPDRRGLRDYTPRRRAGASVASIARTLAGSAEFQRKYGTLSNRKFVERIYRNAFFFNMDEEGVAYWTARLDRGDISRATVAAHFSQTTRFAERNFTHLGTVAVDWTLGLWGYVPQSDYLFASMQSAEGETVTMMLMAFLGSPYVDRVSTVGPPVISDGTKLLAGEVGQPYDRGLFAEGETGTGPRPFTVSTLPPGLVFAKNRVQGTPTQAGTFPVTITLTDARGLQDQRTYELTILPATG